MAVNFVLKQKLFSTYCNILYEWLQLPAYQHNGPKGRVLKEELAAIRKDGKNYLLSPFKYITFYEVILAQNVLEEAHVSDLLAIRKQIGNPLSFYAFCAVHYFLESEW